MSKKNEVPEVDIVVDEKAGVIREVKPEKTRSKKGHERRVNTGIYVILVIMSIVWLAPFVFLVFQSFRSYALESGGMVDYLLPKHWSLDNYRFLFDGSNFFPWCVKALITCGIAAVVQCALLTFAQKKLSNMDSSDKKGRFVWLLCSLAVGLIVFLALAAAVQGMAFAGNIGKLCIAVAMYLVAGYIMARLFTKQDDRLLRQIPGYVADEDSSPLKKLLSLCLEFLALDLILLCIVHPMETSQYLRWYGNTLTIALFVAVLQTIIVLSVSYTLSRLRFKGRKLIMNVVLVLGLFPGFLTMITLYFLLKQLGMTGAGAVPGLILIYVASSGMGYYISKGFFDTIPKSLDVPQDHYAVGKAHRHLHHPDGLHGPLGRLCVRFLRGLWQRAQLQRGCGPLPVGQRERLSGLFHPFLRGRRGGGRAHHGAVPGPAEILRRRRDRRRRKGIRRITQWQV